ncbi:tRNA (adenosine(37)-N6)-threonylcarbamoyltransferase complex dimerization subunit type 1 TsaB [Wenxinia marina]|uniref:Universal bacterial protein YeaZ n=1 Tax=Wenxinia marina DSM 24838 TaxID=1123501 RepID=A0A0D0NQH8_9RHOB|nr:tRNA (adenosine(37)-N6)-threonylcarbamoyltransferase complex dimerization subunit type 1 TsaB [Wenxinia marina]KIQ70530.1 universal bacterial protein YeaZ [Wenxinia marina DSM 24838]GGL52419.1 tRNA N6-adenosine(37)-N6-threonylcarbamoyltransferase complex dimerization subunit TsaB [Wenxinia marina]
MTTLLAFDTSAAHCAAALLSGNRILAERVEEMSRGQAERLMPLLEEVLAEAGLGWRDLDGIGVGTGPGNFTGLRIAVAAARGLALGLGVEAVGVSAFEALADGAPQPCSAIVTAPRGQVYQQTFTADGMTEPALTPGDEAPADALPPIGPDEAVRRIARIAARRLGTGAPRPAPLYVRAADAAPPSDPPPVILR